MLENSKYPFDESVDETIGTIAPCIEAADDEANDTGIRLSHLLLAPKCQCHA